MPGMIIEEYPDEPFVLSARDIERLKTPDNEFERHSWAFLKDVVGTFSA